MEEQNLEPQRTKMTKKGKGRFEAEYVDPKDPERSITLTIYLGTGYTPALLDKLETLVRIP